MATFTTKKGGSTYGTSTQESPTSGTKEDWKQETQSTSSKQKALKHDILGEWKIGELAYAPEHLHLGKIVAINGVHWNCGFPLAYCTMMDERYDGVFTIPLKYLRKMDV
jgi:hypothetical protein